MAAKNRLNVCFIDILLSNSYLRQICDLPFPPTPLPSPKLYDELCGVMGGLINPNMAVNVLQT